MGKIKPFGKKNIIFGVTGQPEPNRAGFGLDHLMQGPNNKLMHSDDIKLSIDLWRMQKYPNRVLNRGLLVAWWKR